MEVRVSGFREDSYFKNFPKVRDANQGWKSILKCPECDQLWLVDRFDKVDYLYAYKIDSDKNVLDYNFFEIHKQQLEKSRGGYSIKKCAMAGCSNNSLKELAYCPECAIKKLNIYE